MQPGGFLTSLTTEQGVPMLVGGFCEAGSELHCLRDFSSLAGLRFHRDDDIVMVDQIIAEKVSALAKPYAWAVGVSARVPGHCHSTGGVIGSPHDHGLSADGALEDIGHGLLLLARPGGPGYILGCEREPAESALLSASPLNQPLVEGPQAAEYLLRQKIPNFLVVSDGTGPHARGYVALCCHHEFSHLQMDELYGKG